MPYNEARRNVNKRVSVYTHAQRKEKVNMYVKIPYR